MAGGNRLGGGGGVVVRIAGVPPRLARSSMMIEGIAGLKEIKPRWESAICVVSGFVSGCLIGFNGFMWSQAVIVEVYPFSVLSFMGVLLCLMRWIYAPDQRRYLYLAFFLFGICFTNHQTLLLAAPALRWQFWRAIHESDAICSRVMASFISLACFFS
ncbi:MAG: DUF2723 domain-containing protein [Limisphaerales bacterium]